MNQDDLDSIFSHAGDFGSALKKAFRELTGEDLDLESAVRHYPLLAVGLATGAGLVGGWWLSNQSQRRLSDRPGSGPSQPIPWSRGAQSSANAPEPAQRWIDRWLPEGIDALRRAVPEAAAEERIESAIAWIDSTLEPKVREGFDAALAQVQTGRVGYYVRERLQNWGFEVERELEDPEQPIEPEASSS